MGSQRKYPPEFRREALELVRTSGRPVTEIAASLGVNHHTLRTWLREDRARRAAAGSDEPLDEAEREELARLRKENLELRTDREILRKAAAYFARETMR